MEEIKVNDKANKILKRIKKHACCSNSTAIIILDELARTAMKVRE